MVTAEEKAILEPVWRAWESSRRMVAPMEGVDANLSRVLGAILNDDADSHFTTFEGHVTSLEENFKTGHSITSLIVDGHNHDGLKLPITLEAARELTPPHHVIGIQPPRHQGHQDVGSGYEPALTRVPIYRANAQSPW